MGRPGSNNLDLMPPPIMQEPRPDQDKAIPSLFGLPRAIRKRLSISVNYYKMPE